MSKAAIRAERYHDISCGHRVHGHESKCAFLHGHNYRIHFTCQVLNPIPVWPEQTRAAAYVQGVDEIGRVIDFSVIKSKLCMWLEDNWDHRFLAWTEDPIIRSLFRYPFDMEAGSVLTESIVYVPFNPTAENMARHLLEVVGPRQLADTGVGLVSVTVEETRKCSASALSYL